MEQEQITQSSHDINSLIQCYVMLKQVHQEDMENNNKIFRRTVKFPGRCSYKILKLLFSHELNCQRRALSDGFIAQINKHYINSVKKFIETLHLSGLYHNLRNKIIGYLA